MQNCNNPGRAPSHEFACMSPHPFHLVCMLRVLQVQKAELAVAQGSRWDRGRGTTMDELEVGCCSARASARHLECHAVQAITGIILHGSAP